MKPVLCLIGLLLLPVASARADAPGVSPAALAMVPEDRRAVLMVTNDEHRWKIFFVLDRRLLVDAGPLYEADVAMKIRPSDHAYFEARCSASATPVCTIIRYHDTDFRPLVLAATLIVIRGDGCIFSASKTDQPLHPIALDCLDEATGAFAPQPMTGVWP